MATADQVELFLSPPESGTRQDNISSATDHTTAVDSVAVAFTETQDCDGEPIIEIQATEIQSISATDADGNVPICEREYVTITTNGDLTFTEGTGDVLGDGEQGSDIRVVIHDVREEVREERIEISTPDQELEPPSEEQEYKTQDLEVVQDLEEVEECQEYKTVSRKSDQESVNPQKEDCVDRIEDENGSPRSECENGDTEKQNEEEEETEIINEQEKGNNPIFSDKQERGNNSIMSDEEETEILNNQEKGNNSEDPKSKAPETGTRPKRNASMPSKIKDWSNLGRPKTKNKRKIPVVEICATCGKDGDHARLGLVVRRMGHVCESKDEFLMIDSLFRGDFTEIRDTMRICRPCARKLDSIHKFINLCQPNIDDYFKKCGLDPDREKPTSIVTGSPNQRLYRVPATLEWVKRIKVTSDDPVAPQRTSTRRNFGQKRSYGNQPVSILPKTSESGKRIKLDRAAKRGLEKGDYQEGLSAETEEMTIITGTGKELQPVPIQLYKAKHVTSDCAYIPLTALLPNSTELSHQSRSVEGQGASLKSCNKKDSRFDNQQSSEASTEITVGKNVAPVKPSKPLSDPIKMKRNAERLILRRSRSLSNEGSSLANKVREVSQTGRSMLFNSDPSLLMYNYTSGAMILEMESKCPELLEMLCGLTGDKVSIENRISTISTIYSMIVHCQSKKASAIQKIFPAIQNG